MLMDRGFTKVRPLAGGLDAWVSAGYDVDVEEFGERIAFAATYDPWSRGEKLRFIESP